MLVEPKAVKEHIVNYYHDLLGKPHQEVCEGLRHLDRFVLRKLHGDQQRELEAEVTVGEVEVEMFEVRLFFIVFEDERQLTSSI